MARSLRLGVDTGLQPGDLITGVNGKEVGDTADFSVATADVRVGERVVLDVTRDTRATKVEFIIQEVPR